jgi:hypothetical protein
MSYRPIVVILVDDFAVCKSATCKLSEFYLHTLMILMIEARSMPPNHRRNIMYMLFKFMPLLSSRGSSLIESFIASSRIPYPLHHSLASPFKLVFS